MSDERDGVSPALKLLIGSAIGIGVGFGTCGMGAVVANSSRIASRILVPFGLILFGLSVLGFVVAAVWLVVDLIGGWRR